jgi:hypothetical protein
MCTQVRFCVRVATRLLTLPFCGIFENGFVVVTALDEDTVAIVDVQHLLQQVKLL